jgi:hypothetical protein
MSSICIALLASFKSYTAENYSSQNRLFMQ